MLINGKSFLGLIGKQRISQSDWIHWEKWRQNPRDMLKVKPSREREYRTLICGQGNRCKRQGNRRFQWKSFERCGWVGRSRENGVGRNVWCGRFYRGIHGGQLVLEVATRVSATFLNPRLSGSPLVPNAIVSSVPNSWSNSSWWNLENNFDKNAILVLDNYIQDDRLPRRSQYLL